MSATTFQHITEKIMGKISVWTDRKLKRLQRKREALLSEVDSVDKELMACVHKQGVRLQVDFEHAAFRGIGVDDDRNLVATFCPCPHCQAVLNNVTVVQATEAMLKAGKIAPSEKDAYMKQATEIDNDKAKNKQKQYVH